MTKATLKRRDFLGLAGAAAMGAALPAPAKAFGSAVILGLAALEETADIVDLGIDSFYTVSGNPIPQLGDITAKGQNLVETQEAILQAVKDLNIAIPREIETAFRDNHKRHLQAEIDDFIIMTADGALPLPDRNLYEKARRLERLSVTMADYGPAALPSFVTANVLLYAVNGALGRDHDTQRSLYSAHIKTIDGWIENDTSGIVSRYMEEHRLQLGRRLTGDSTSRIQTIDVGHADYRDGDQVIRSQMRLRIHQDAQDARISVYPVVHETVDIMALDGYLTANGLTAEQFPQGFTRYSTSDVPADFAEAFPHMIRPITTEQSYNSSQADNNAESWLNRTIAAPMERIVNDYYGNRETRDQQYNDLVRYIDTLETVSSKLKKAANDLSPATAKQQPTIIRNIPKPQ